LGGASALTHDLSSVLGSGQLTQAQVQAARGLSTMPSVGSTLPPFALLGTQLPQQTQDHNLVMLRLGILSQRIQEAARPQSDMSPFSSLNSLSNFSSLNSRTIGSSMSTWAPTSDQDRVSAFQVAARHRTHGDEGGSSSSAQHAHTLSHTHSHYHDHDDLIADAEALASITSIASINSVSSAGSKGRASSPRPPLRSLHSRRRKDSDEPQEPCKNKNCHFCEHAPKRSAFFACLNPSCDQTFCENCCARHLAKPTNFQCQDDADKADWRCPICTRMCCCVLGTCTKKHLHCKRYRRKLKNWRTLG